MKHGLKKAVSTARILFNLGMARTFGHYEYSGHTEDGVDYARYRWRRQSWIIPTSFVQDEYACLVPKLRCGFRSANQLPAFMVWREWWDGNEVVHADVIFNSLDYIGV